MADLFIPSKIRVGFQTRTDTYSGKLAYVIYYDTKGKIRKEKSWDSWRDHKIAPVEFDNKPRSGFVLNKGVQRYNWSHFGSGRSMIRIYDQREIEFEITPDNLIGILAETDCSRRELDGEFVYAWKGTDLLLLPCGSEAYQHAVKHTQRQAKKISARDLREGFSYTTKSGEEVIYIGRFPWFSWNLPESSRVSVKRHIFADAKQDPTKKEKSRRWTPLFIPKDGATHLAEVNSEEAVPNYGDFVEAFKADIRSATIVGWESHPLDPKQFRPPSEPTNDHYRHHLPEMEQSVFTKLVDHTIVFSRVYCMYHHRPRFMDKKWEFNGYQVEEVGELDTKTYVYRPKDPHNIHGYYYRTREGKGMSRENFELIMKDHVNVDMILSNGRKIRVSKMQDLTH